MSAVTTNPTAADDPIDAVRRDRQGRSALGNPTGWWGVVILLMTEGGLFASLLLAYFYSRSTASVWPPPGIAPPELMRPLIMTALLLSSSVTMIWAELSIRRGNQAGLRAGLAVSWLLAAGFLLLQAYEYSHETFGLSDGVYGSAFFTITGIHGLHVAGALLLMAVIQVRAWLGHFDRDHLLAVSAGALYWHFVDVVWIFILASLYLTPHFF